jgi:predicted DNA-binding transcriptional regulator AlpA
MQQLTLQQALARAGVPRSTYYVLRARGEFPEPTVNRIGRGFLAYDPAVIDAWKREHGGKRLSK